ncbi:MAG: D-Ala-D-Ala carboxypeptidase family metallohydrolase [Solirubrobacteraceae bacterium]
MNRSRLISRSLWRMLAAAVVAVAVAACGSAGDNGVGGAASGSSAVPAAHPQAIQPTAGVQAVASATGDAIVGDVSAHAPTLAQVKHELKQLNLCGGATSAAEATPLIQSSLPGFIADPGTSQLQGELPALTGALNALGKALGVTIYGISGYRSPAHSVAVGGFANDPHTQGKAEDIGVNSLLRSSAAQISEAELARFGLYRPFDPSDDPSNSEVNHIQLIPSGGPLTLAQATSAFDPDPTCK